MTTKDNIKKFIEDVKRKATKNGAEVCFVDDVFLTDVDGQKCVGWFDGEKGNLSVATKRPQNLFLSILVHESSHLDQWVENRYLWDKLNPGYTLFFEWLGGKICKREHLEEAVQDIIRLELDCEKRAIKKILQYNLPIDLDKYKRRANSYLYAYLYFFEKRTWIPGIYVDKLVWGAAPVRFAASYKKIPPTLYSRFKEAHNKFKK